MTTENKSKKTSEKQAKKNQKKGNVGQHTETYWDYAGEEAVKRGGAGSQLKGLIQEIAVRDKKNISADGVISGKVTRLTKSTTAKSADIVTVKNNKIIERVQVKDVTSKSGLRDVQSKVKTGQYRNSKLVGSEETTELYQKAAKGTTKKMTSSGVSSKTTTRAADNAGVKVRERNLLINNLKDVVGQAKTSGVVGAAIGGVSEAINGLSDLKNGTVTGTEYTGKVVKESVKSGTKSAAKTAAALALKEGAKEVAKKAGNQALKKAAGSNPATAVAFGVVDQVIDTAKFATGNIDSKEFRDNSCRNVGSTSGAVGGAILGAELGSIVPGVGTAIGAVVGGIIGGISGGGLGRKLSDLFD